MACLTPVNIRVKTRHNSSDFLYNPVPCGKCPKCREQRIKGWAFRLQQQERLHLCSLFITLTYSPENVPMTANGFMTLDKSDLQKFLKRLRYNTGRKTIKYYAVGEYGTTTWRPHYHAIIFDVTIEEVQQAWSLDGQAIGHVHAGTVTGDSIAYTAKYVAKPSRIPLHDKDDRIPEFSLMSKGMGANYLYDTITVRACKLKTRKEHDVKILVPKKQVERWHKDHWASYLLLEGGYHMALPRYYREKIFSEIERAALGQAAKEVHAERMAKQIDAAGGDIVEFYRAQHAAVKAIFRSYQKQTDAKRNKI